MHLPVNNAYVIGVSLAYSMVTICARLAYDGGSNVLSFVAFRALVVTAVLAALLAWRGLSLRLPADERGACALIGLLLAGSNFSLNQAIALLPVANALLIFYTYPLLLALAGWLTGRDRPTLRMAGAMALSLVGLALTLQVQGGHLDPLGLLYAFLAAASWGGMMFMTGRLLGGRKTQVHTLHMMLAVSVLFALALLWTGDLALPTATAGWVGFAAAPAFYLLAFVGTVTAVSALGAVRTGFFSNFESVGVIVFAALILGQYMSAMQMAGAALVITSMFIFSAPPRTPAADRPAG